MNDQWIQFFFEFQVNLKLYHWMTQSYARHCASDELFAKLSDKVDRFVEVCIGRHGKPKAHKKTIKYETMTEKEIVPYLKTKVEYLEKLQLTSELDNIRVEIIEAIEQALYLFALE